MSFILRSLLLSGSLLASLPVVTSHASHQSISKRDLFDGEAVIIKGQWSCSSQQILDIDQGVVEAHELANAALTALGKSNVARTPAYFSWFGPESGGPSASNLIEKHYRPVIDSLKPPSVETAFRFSPEPLFPPNTVTDKSLVFGCSGNNGPCADGQMVAGVQSATDTEAAVFGTTLLLLCETFFDKTRPTNQGMVKQWQAESAIGDMSKGFVLVHETQHMLIATGAGERADDLKNPFFRFLDDRSEDCYSATCCSRLSAAEKVKNAQNYAIFALDSMAFPNAEEQPACPASPASSTLVRQKRQVRFDNSTTSSAPPSLSRTPLPPTIVTSTSKPPSRVATPTPSRSAEPEVITVSGTVAVVIPAGAVAFGGPGGGLASFGGVIVPVPEGQTVSDPSKDPQQSGPDEPTNTPRQTQSPTTSSKPVSSSAPCSKPAEKTYKPAVENVCEDWSGMNQTAFKPLIAGIPLVDWEGAPVVSTTSILETVEVTTMLVTSTAAPAPSATPSAEPKVDPVACYNFDINAYGYCCPGEGNPCQNDIGKCYFNGEGVSGGASGIVPDGARCPPPPGAEYCRGACEE
ncbi:hypothetical protein CaCOL14_011780 [Colletotrichum acutatum]